MDEGNTVGVDILFPDLAGTKDVAPDQEAGRVEHLSRRIAEKLSAYQHYQFTKRESRALNVFFDLAQEFTDKQDLWTLTVLIPKVIFGKSARLYLLNAHKRLEWRCCSEGGCAPKSPADVPEPVLVEVPTLTDGRYFIPIKGNHELLSQLPFEPDKDLIGLLEVFPAGDFGDHERLFFEKYANRIGYRIHNRLIAGKNQEHLEFIRNLVQDIGHNVIVPNMYFKLFYRRLESRIMRLRDITAKFTEFTSDCSLEDPEKENECRRIQRDIDSAFDSLMSQYREIYRHYEQTSMFLETLLRRSHFEQGRYVIEPRPCNLRVQIVEPQLERYRARLEERGVRIEAGPGTREVPDPQVLADVGLISQVVANLFSNAVKYARDEDGQGPRLVYDWRVVPSFDGHQEEAVLVTVLTSGAPIPEDDVPKLYSEGFRSRNASSEYGTGHGLSFIKEVVRLHRGAVGYERDDGGNVFFFYLPTQAED
ncbi:ATP-binding region ATPase domain protein [Desulfovibrio sp. X2]|uniref:sensor histidine kinase n=1 Tax=Desulfovibrio sp. X2 TaxID=941449 RepID=UPI00035871A3|nr:HAMP domain-containing sensor histidine kinase [Desulfovibrio sp. X2]EPR40838.1 ATP-binding region ATPase domain protein [Desulfovibrio sp. X2]